MGARPVADEARANGRLGAPEPGRVLVSIDHCGSVVVPVDVAEHLVATVQALALTPGGWQETARILEDIRSAASGDEPSADEAHLPRIHIRAPLAGF